MNQPNMKCLQSNCPLRLKCAIANGQVKGNITIFRGYLKEYESCEHYKSIKKDGRQTHIQSQHTAETI